MTDPSSTPPAARPETAAETTAESGGALSEDAVVRLRLVIARLNRQMAQAASGKDLTFAQLSALARVEQYGPLRLGELAARERVAVPSMIRTVGPLTAAGLVAKTPDPLDGRSQLLELTAAGLDAITRIRRERSALLAHRSGRLTPRQCRDLEAAIPVLELLLDEPEPTAPVADTATGTSSDAGTAG
ncbi:MarR family winged helix-turn-helix transcriptional regulator [Saccharothrix sp. ST-888]|uniref:MarR family winged helix-turn-helix transcriptional regulator n=1 Tax=Saccharothrix sp. ST-888 TaxID=1427391 RepID=UPI00069649CC|nr:MarR family transcriptional regulator [Saccharothrix sp. ST-888]